MYCSSCGKQISVDSKFCPHCGGNVNGNANQNNGQFQMQSTLPQTQHINSNDSTYNTPQVRAIIGNNADYYIDAFEKMQITGNTNSWNFAACLLGIWWMLYRGMIKHPVFFILIGLTVIAWVTKFVFIGFFISLGAGLYMGIKGNYLYKNYIDERIKQMQMRGY